MRSVRLVHGWTDLPAASATAPVERWRIPHPQDADYSLDDTGTVLVVASPTGSSTRVQRLDIATGAPMWTGELPATELPTVKLLGAPPTAVVVTGGRRAVVAQRLVPLSPSIPSTSTATQPARLFRCMKAMSAARRGTGDGHTRPW